MTILKIRLSFKKCFELFQKENKIIEKFKQFIQTKKKKERKKERKKEISNKPSTNDTPAHSNAALIALLVE